MIKMTQVYVATDNIAGYSRGILATVLNETAKAIQFESRSVHSGKTVTAWFPKKALVNMKIKSHGDETTTRYDLAPWFQRSVDGWTKTFIDLTADSSLF
jgi:hypothetical protein